MALNQKEITALIATNKRQQYGCGDGLNIIVEPVSKGGGKSFEGRFRMKVNDKIKQIPVRIGVFGTKLGQYTLKRAHQKWLEIKLWAQKENRDPRQFGKSTKLCSSINFKQLVDAFLLNKTNLKEHTLKNYKLQLENQVLTMIDGKMPLADLEWDKGGRESVIKIINKISERGSFNQAVRVQKLLSQCFDYAIDEGWMARGQNPAVKQSKDNSCNKIKHHPTVEWSQVPALLEAINLNQCASHSLVVLSVKFMLLTFLRAGALVRLRWDWIDAENKVMIIPGHTPGLKRTRKTEDLYHHIPITPEMESILHHAKKLPFSNEYIFGAYRKCKYPHLSPEAPNNFLINIGYKGILTAHGWRSVPLTVGQDRLKISHEIIQRQMGHLIGDKVRRAYDNSIMLDERREFLEKWSKLLVEHGLAIPI